MPINLDNEIWLKLVADETTPTHLTEYADVRILLSPSQAAQFPQQGQHDFFTVLGVQVYGYVRPVNDGSGSYEWVMQSTPEPIVLVVQALPGPQGWTNEAAGQVYVNLGRELLVRGSSIGEVQYALQQLYNAARADV
jgi:hypothetical protein